MREYPYIRRTSRTLRRRGAATVELSLTAPFLLMMLAAAADFARVYYYSQTLTACAWNGACVAADPDMADRLPYASVEETTLAGAEGLQPPPMVEVNYGSDELEQPYAEVTVRWIFRPLIPLPQQVAEIGMVKTARMPMRPQGEE